jgi:hypothetical protein
MHTKYMTLDEELDLNEQIIEPATGKAKSL